MFKWFGNISLKIPEKFLIGEKSKTLRKRTGTINLKAFEEMLLLFLSSSASSNSPVLRDKIISMSHSYPSKGIQHFWIFVFYLCVFISDIYSHTSLVLVLLHTWVVAVLLASTQKKIYEYQIQNFPISISDIHIMGLLWTPMKPLFFEYHIIFANLFFFKSLCVYFQHEKISSITELVIFT